MDDNTSEASQQKREQMGADGDSPTKEVQESPAFLEWLDKRRKQEPEEAKEAKAAPTPKLVEFADKHLEEKRAAQDAHPPQGRSAAKPRSALEWLVPVVMAIYFTSVLNKRGLEESWKLLRQSWPVLLILSYYAAVYLLLPVAAFFIGLYIVVRFVKWTWQREKKPASEKQTPNGGASNQNKGGWSQQYEAQPWTQQQWEEWAFQTFPWLREMKGKRPLEAVCTSQRSPFREPTMAGKRS